MWPPIRTDPQSAHTMPTTFPQAGHAMWPAAPDERTTVPQAQTVPIRTDAPAADACSGGTPVPPKKDEWMILCTSALTQEDTMTIRIRI